MWPRLLQMSESGQRSLAVGDPADEGASRQNAAPRKIVVQVPQVLVRFCENVFVSCGNASRGDRPARPLRGAVASVPSWARANFELQLTKAMKSTYGLKIPEPDPELTRIKPGTPYSELMRRYWQPVCLSADLQEL